jgi:RNA polymerase sigma factor (sigma-70 family)
MGQLATSSTQTPPESDADLLCYMSMRDADATGARAAWQEFYSRHATYMYRVCSGFGALLGGEAGVLDLIQDTFCRAFERAGQFDPAGVADPVQLRRRARAWLGRIANNLVLTKLRADRKSSVLLVEPEAFNDLPVDASNDNCAQPSSGSATRYRRALAGLSVLQREAMRLYGTYHQVGRPNQKLPDGIAEAAAERLGTTPENLRQIKKRAIDQVRAFLENDPSSSRAE